jgi:D-glycero-D-manno-heptose 1,7-bisphosphate phosphatase
MKKPAAVFFDRDGLINQPPPPERRYVTCPEQFHLMPGTARAIQILNHHHIPVAVVTNQKGIALGLYTPEDLARIHARMKELLAAEGAHIDDLQFCPHQESDACSCRKPLPGLLLQAAQALGVDPSDCWMIGDQPRDLEAGRAAGCRTVGVGEADFPPEVTDVVLSSTTEIPVWFSKHFPFQSRDELA